MVVCLCGALVCVVETRRQGGGGWQRKSIELDYNCSNDNTNNGTCYGTDNGMSTSTYWTRTKYNSTLYYIVSSEIHKERLAYGAGDCTYLLIRHSLGGNYKKAIESLSLLVM